MGVLAQRARTPDVRTGSYPSIALIMRFAVERSFTGTPHLGELHSWDLPAKLLF